MQIMVAEDHRHIVAVRIKPAEHTQVVRSPVDQIANTPESILVSVKLDALQKLLEWREATLNVADNICAHSWPRPLLS